jgi:hypothetical protein
MSSTKEMLAQGLVLGLNLTLFLFAFSQWKLTKNLDSWFTTVITVLDKRTQMMGVVLFGIGFVLLCVLFLFS